jgi:hypothetical protein
MLYAGGKRKKLNELKTLILIKIKRMIMKKILMLVACTAAMTAITSCSSNDDDVLPQATVAPAAEETVVETAKGTPFSISVSGDTRATLYGTTGWTAANSTSSNWIKDIKIYGIQKSDDPVVNNNWMKSNVFTRAKYDTDTWTTSRDAESTSASTPTWPTTNTSVATKFYAITDNAIGDGLVAEISNVGPWMSPEGTFTYTMSYLTANLPHIDSFEGTGYLVTGGVETNYVDVSNLKDLMVASTTKKESETTSGQLSLNFSHVLAGLNVKLIFRNDDYQNTGQVQYIHYIKIMGLKTSGTYTFNPTGTNPNWDTSAGTYLCYYKNFGTPIQITADPQSYSATQADHNKWLVEKNDPWMVIPQTTDPWNGIGLATGSGAEYYITSGKAYIVLGLSNEDMEDIEAFLPLNTTFNAGTNKTLRLDLGAFLDLYSGTPGSAAPLLFAPAGGGGTTARGYDFIDE